MFELFSDIFACRENALTRIDPRPKLIIAFSLILAIVLSQRVLLPSFAAVAAVGTMLALRIPLKLVLLRLSAPVGIVVVLVALRAFLTSGTPLLVVTPFGCTITATEEGLISGILLGSRVLGAVSVVLLLSSVTPAYKIFAALRWFRVPEGWVEIAFLVYRYVFVLLEQASDVQAAQKARLGHSSIRRSLSSIGILAGTVMARSIDQAFRTHEAMMLRGYQGRYPFGPLAGMSRVDRWLAGVAPCFVVAAFLVAERWPK
jgi:cobalt/nickel transport system permease protein